MASSRPARSQFVGTTALPIVMTATMGAGDVATWTHNRGVNPTLVTVIKAVGRQPVQFPAGAAAGLGFVVTFPDVNTVVVTNTSAVALDVVLKVDWNVPSDVLGAAVAAAAVVLS